MIDYIKHFDSNKTMFFKVIDKELLKRYIKILERINNLICKEFESELVYGDNDRYIKTKIKSYGNKVNTDFQRKKIPKENALYKCLSLIVLGHCLKIVRIRSFSGPCFPTFGLNTERFGVSLRTESKCGKIRTRKTPNMNNFYAVWCIARSCK